MLSVSSPSPIIIRIVISIINILNAVCGAKYYVDDEETQNKPLGFHSKADQTLVVWEGCMWISTRSQTGVGLSLVNYVTWAS